MFKVEFTQEERDTILVMITIADLVELPNETARNARLAMQPTILSVIDKLNPPKPTPAPRTSDAEEKNG